MTDYKNYPIICYNNKNAYIIKIDNNCNVDNYAHISNIRPIKIIILANLNIEQDSYKNMQFVFLENSI